ncbi:sigma-70 family RNA polymerase sigma factor [Candidatus Sumerlaeota bacterium]|nr:sigma-70 family RNA polymerase sigma factor [Candidatus Sumerlaeota bacterium]
MPLQDVPAELVVRCQQGDRAAFEVLVAQIGPDLYRMIFAQVRDHDDTDEILQECLIRVYKHLPTLREVAKFPGWMARMVVNQCHSHRLKRSRTAVESIEETADPSTLEVMWQDPHAANPRRALLRKEMMADINEAISSLPTRQRSAIVLFEVEDLPIREIARVMNCSEGAVKFNIHQARKKLKLALRQYVRQRPSERQTNAEG